MVFGAFLRISVLTIAAVVTALLIAAFNAGSPELHSVANAAADVVADRAEAAPAPRHFEHHTYLTVADLPAVGDAEAADLIAPLDSAETPLHFTARRTPPLSDDKVLHAAFLKPEVRAIALARLPQARPNRIFIIGPDGTAIANPMVLAYAEPPSRLEAPFDALFAEPKTASAGEPVDDGIYRPRPRPNPAEVLAWLDGRALGQFAPGQHPWVQNTLPASVFEPKEQKCLAEGIYFEARGEPETGQAAVAQVILNRVRNPAYPDTICGVVYQDQRHRHHCQFSFACDGRPERVEEWPQWENAKTIAARRHERQDLDRRGRRLHPLSRKLRAAALGTAHDPGRPNRRPHLLPNQARRLVVEQVFCLLRQIEARPQGGAFLIWGDDTAHVNPLPEGEGVAEGDG